MQSKRDIRLKVQTLFLQHSAEELGVMSRVICSRLLELEEIKEGNVIAAFYPLSDEPDIIPLLNILCLSGKRILLPEVVSSKELIWRHYNSFDQMLSGALGTQYPEGDIFNDLSQIDVVIVPGRAFSKKGERVGRGKGYYDRFLARVPDVITIGVAFSFQMFEKVPVDPYDIRIDKVVTSF